MLTLDRDSRIGKAGSYRYCLRCGTLFSRPKDAIFHFGENIVPGRPSHKIHYLPRIPCSGIPAGFPHPNPAPGARVPDLAYQEAVPARRKPR